MPPFEGVSPGVELPNLSVEFVEDTSQPTNARHTSVDETGLYPHKTCLGAERRRKHGSWHATITSPWLTPDDDEAGCALSVPHAQPDETPDHFNPDKDDSTRIQMATQGAHRRGVRHNSWYGEIQSPWVTEFHIDVGELHTGSTPSPTNTDEAGPAALTDDATHLGVPMLNIGNERPKKAVDPEALWLQKWHVHVENVETPHGDYTVGISHDSDMDISHLHPVNDFHLERIDLRHMHQIHEHTLGGYRRQKHKSWHVEVKAQWIDEYHDASDDEEDQDFDIVVRSPHLRELKLH
eukprot:m.131710 g.131710  ORF g.131710 m.131710 type:complete len:294 (-) comp13769_c0_seq1:118-999(-)